MEEGKYYMIWYKDDSKQSRSRAIQFIRATDIDVEFLNIVTGRVESLFKGTFLSGLGRSKEYNSLEEIQKELENISLSKENGRKNNNRFKSNKFY